jgi:NAD/NADP transhydrogenase alpha subunit
MNDLNEAITLVERVMHTLSSAQQWSTFLHQYTELYAQAAITEVRRNQDSQAHAILSSFARIAGKDAIVQQIKAYEDTIPTRGDEVTEDEARANTDLVKRLAELRKRL